jgi:uncharacterized membrane protein
VAPPERRVRRPAPGTVGFAVAAAAMVATPLCAQGGRARRALATGTVAGLAVTTATRARRRWGAPRAAAAAATVAAGTWALERIGTRTGLPFGRYEYTDALRPVVGGVPVLVPLAWWAMALPARETGAAVVGPGAGRPMRIAAGAVALTAWDLFLDPQMVGEGYWRWARTGRYRGIPASNFAGWLVAAGAVMGALDLLLAPREGADVASVGEYAFMSVMETVGFAAFFRDRVVAVTGGAATLPLAAIALVRTVART